MLVFVHNASHTLKAPKTFQSRLYDDADEFCYMQPILSIVWWARGVCVCGSGSTNTGEEFVEKCQLAEWMTGMVWVFFVSINFNSFSIHFHVPYVY